MTLEPDDVQKFYRVWWPLLRYVNATRKVVPDPDPWPPEGQIDPNHAAAIRNALWADDSLLEAFVGKNPGGLAASWRHRLFGQFWVVRHLKKHSILLEEGPPPRAYGVLGLMSDLTEVAGTDLPRLVNTTLLPFGDRIVYDGLLTGYRISFGGGIRSHVNQDYREAREREGIITSLPAPSGPGTTEDARKAAAAHNAAVVSAFRTRLMRAELSDRAIGEHLRWVQALADELLQDEPPRALVAMAPSDLEHFLSAAPDPEEERERLTSLKELVRFVVDTERVEAEASWRLDSFVRHYRPRPRAGRRR